MGQKTLNGKNTNCLEINEKHDWELIDYNAYYYKFKCKKCPAEKHQSIYEYNKVKK